MTFGPTLANEIELTRAMTRYRPIPRVAIEVPTIVPQTLQILVELKPPAPATVIESRKRNMVMRYASPNGVDG